MTNRQLRTWVAAIASWGMILSPVVAAPPGQALVADVALAEGGVFSGQLVDAQGVAVAGAPVALLSQGREVASVATGGDGSFSIGGLKGGVYELATPAGREVYRLWSPRTAPPAARHAVMVVVGEPAVRGQYGPPPGPIIGPPPGPVAGPPLGPPPAPGPFGKAMNWVSNHPFITTGIIATAIAVPLALSDDNDDAS